LPRWIDDYSQYDNQLNNASRILYPSLPDPPLPLSLPLSAYIGTYTHPAYQNITIEERDGSLFANRNEAVWKTTFKFEHVSGEFFLCYADSANAKKSPLESIIQAEFVIGSDGAVTRFGMAAEVQMGPEGRIWFDRI